MAYTHFINRADMFSRWMDIGRRGYGKTSFVLDMFAAMIDSEAMEWAPRRYLDATKGYQPRYGPKSDHVYDALLRPREERTVLDIRPIKLKDLPDVYFSRTGERFPFIYHEKLHPDLWAGVIMAYFQDNILTFDETFNLYMELAGHSPGSDHYRWFAEKLMEAHSKRNAGDPDWDKEIRFNPEWDEDIRLGVKS